ncbi:MAG: stage III sporulation protein AB [Clostridiaceae bacterium]|jgi:hypothetical protein|nr:stage III sporulation protein AB [Clostridiaceae bacterium]
MLLTDALRLAAGGLLAVAGAASGLAAKRIYSERARFYADVCEFAEVAEKEISFLKTPLKDIIDKFISAHGAHNSEFARILKTHGECLRKGNRLKIESKYVRREEAEEIETFLNLLGKNDYARTLKDLSVYRESFGRTLVKKEEEAKRLGGMYFKLLTLLGVALMIIVA